MSERDLAPKNHFVGPHEHRVEVPEPERNTLEQAIELCVGGTFGRAKRIHAADYLRVA
jgi:hypothetical protein